MLLVGGVRAILLGTMGERMKNGENGVDTARDLVVEAAGLSASLKRSVAAIEKLHVGLRESEGFAQSRLEKGLRSKFAIGGADTIDSVDVIENMRKLFGNTAREIMELAQGYERDGRWENGFDKTKWDKLCELARWYVRVTRIILSEFKVEG